MSATTTKPPLSTRLKLGYGSGQLAWAAKDTCFQFFLFFYYTQILGLSPKLAGLAALLALIADGLSDPIIGQLSDQFRGKKWGRRHPFMIAAMVPFCAALVAIFNPPAGMSQTALFAWYLIMAITVRSFLTLFTVPHMALGAEMSEDYTERTSIVVWRTLLGYTGGIGIQLIAWFVLIPNAVASGAVQDGYRNIGFVAASLALIGMAIAIVATKPIIPNLPTASVAQQKEHWHSGFTNIYRLLGQQSARVLLLGNLVMVTTIGVSNTMLLHVNSFFYGLSSEQTGAMIMSILLALAPASWLATQGSRVLGKPKAVVTFILIFGLLGPLPVLAHLYGYTPASGTAALVLLLCIFAALHQSFYIAHVNIVAAMLPDVADEVELHTGLRQEGILNSAVMLTQKVSFGLGAFVAGLLIDFVGFSVLSDSGELTPEMISKLAWVYGPGVALLILFGALVYSHYKLNEARYREIRAALA